MNEWPRCGGSKRPTISPVGAVTASPRVRPARRPLSAVLASAVLASALLASAAQTSAVGVGHADEPVDHTQPARFHRLVFRVGALAEQRGRRVCHERPRHAVTDTGRGRPRLLQTLGRRIAVAGVPQSRRRGDPRVDAIEIGRPLVGPHLVRVGDGRHEVTRERRRDRVDGRAVRHVGADVEQHGQRLLGPAGLAQPERQRGSNLGAFAAHRRRAGRAPTR